MELLNSPQDKIRFIIEYEPKVRKEIHRWLRSKGVYSTGLLVSAFRHDSMTCVLCHNCKNKVILNEYHYGIMENNQDEWSSGKCDKCDERIFYEHNYDSGVSFNFDCRNVLAVGEFFKSYSSDFQEKSNDSKILKLLEKRTVYEIDTPDKILNRNKLGEYISNTVSKGEN